MLVEVPVFAGVSDADAVTLCCVMAFGLLGFGKVPTEWSGIPLALSDRWVAVQLHVAWLVNPAEGFAVVSL